jgi:hypothetical protein
MSQRFKDFSITNANVLRNVDPAVKSCLWTADDAYDIYFKEGVSLSDLLRILFNFIYRFGNMVDRIYELYTISNYQIVSPYISAIEWQLVGSIYGHLVQQIFFPDYYPDIPIVYPAEE